MLRTLIRVKFICMEYIFYSRNQVYRGYSQVCAYAHYAHMRMIGRRGVIPFMRVLLQVKKSIN